MPDERENEDGGAANIQQNRGSVSSFIFMSFVLFMLANSGGDDYIIKNQYRNSLASLERQQANFSQWWHGSPSNFSLPETNVSELAFVQSIMTFGNPLNPSYASYYNNITGFIHGPANFYNLSSYLDFPDSPNIPPFGIDAGPLLAELNKTEMEQKLGTWNWTACDNMAMRVLDIRPILPQDATAENTTSLDDISLIRGKFELKDPTTGEEMRFDVEGIHFINNGSLYGLGETVGRSVDIRKLPAIVPPAYLNVTAQAIDVELKSRIQRLRNMIQSSNVEVDLSTDETLKSTCPFTLYAQIVPTELSLPDMKELESEMENPTGISVSERPELRLNGVLLSRQCGLMYEFRDAQGLKPITEVLAQGYYMLAPSLEDFAVRPNIFLDAGTATVVYLVLLYLMVQQTELSRTPARIARLSRWSFMAQAAADAIFFVGHVSFGVLSDGRPSLSLIAPAFLACILMVFEARFAVLIQSIQAPEESVTTPPAAPSPPPAETNPAGPILPVSAGSPSQLRFFQRMYSRIRDNPQARVVLTILATFVLVVRILVSPLLALIITGTIYTMFWMPQIIRSARRDSAGLLRVDYVIGTTLCRVFFVLYLFACPTNVLGLETSNGIWFLVGLVFLQASIVVLQDWLGPTFFLPEDYVKVEKYDYHPPIPVPDAEAPERSLGDCVICLDAITIHPDHVHGRRSLSEKSEKDGRTSGGVLDALKGSIEAAGRGAGGARKSWAVAPCHHIFHTSCLEQWLAIKNICPQCRRPLPPL